MEKQEAPFGEMAEGSEQIKQMKWLVLAEAMRLGFRRNLAIEFEDGTWVFGSPCRQLWTRIEAGEDLAVIAENGVRRVARAILARSGDMGEPMTLAELDIPEAEKRAVVRALAFAANKAGRPQAGLNQTSHKQLDRLDRVLAVVAPDIAASEVQVVEQTETMVVFRYADQCCAIPRGPLQEQAVGGARG